MPEAAEHLDKARQLVNRARIILAAGVAEDAARDAYLAAFHAAQALIAEAQAGGSTPTRASMFSLPGS
jgi:uncharacterized protein (UPF0332 family)